MAISSEYTYWHLTPTGWVAGDSKTDFNRWSVGQPTNTLKSVLYTEEIKGDIRLKRDSVIIFEDTNKSLVLETESKYPYKPHIMVYS